MKPTTHPSLSLVELDDAPVEGVWCDVCLLPSAASMRCAIYDRRDPTRVWWAGRLFTCRDCARQWREREYGDAPKGVRFA